MLQVLISNSKCVWVFSCVGRNFIRKVQPRCMSRLNATSCICMFDTNASIVCRRTKRTECMPMCRCGWRGNITKRMKRRRERERMNKLNKHGDVVLVLVLVLKPTHTHLAQCERNASARTSTLCPWACNVQYAHRNSIRIDYENEINILFRFRTRYNKKCTVAMRMQKIYYKQTNDIEK